MFLPITRICTLNPTHKEIRPIAALSHDWGNWVIEGDIEKRTCTHDASHTETRPLTFTSISALEIYLSGKPVNTTATAYTIVLNIDNEDDITSLKTTLNSAADKYVYLDLSGSTITTIPENAFNIGNPSWTGCVTLIGITIPNSVTSIGRCAFYECTTLTSITIPNSVTNIGLYAFYNCTSLESITIPNSVTSIGDSAFSGCWGLTSVTFQGTITADKLDNRAFYGLGDLRDKYLAGGIGTYTRESDGTEWTKI